MKHKDQKGFTLIEMVIVMAVYLVVIGVGEVGSKSLESVCCDVVAVDGIIGAYFNIGSKAIGSVCCYCVAVDGIIISS